MIFWGTSVYGDKILLGEPSAAMLLHDRDAPADMLKAEFPADKMWDELAELELRESGNAVFRGVVDEQNTTLSSSGLKVEIVARSPEALLLDNEAEPCTVLSPSLAKLESKFLQPLGFSLGVGDRAEKQGELVVNKGDSVWEVLERFCADYLGAVPYVDLTGRVQCSADADESAELSQVISAQIKQLPCKRISEVWQQSCRGSYDTPYRSGAKGVQRRRYLSMESGKSPMQIINESEKESFLITVTCAGAQWLRGRSKVTVDIPGVGSFTECPVRSIRYKCDKNGEQTTLLLECGRKGENLNVAYKTA